MYVGLEDDVCKIQVVRLRVLSQFDLDSNRVNWLLPFFPWFEYDMDYVCPAITFFGVPFACLDATHLGISYLVW